MDQIKMGKLIAKIRKEKNMTQQDLATKLGINSKSISRWENGNQAPDIAILKPLALELEITVDELLSGERNDIDVLNIETKINAIIDYNKCKYQITKIKDLPDRYDYENDNTIIEAYIFGIDIIIHKTMAFLTLKLSDMTSSIIARVLVSTKYLSKTLENIKLGTSWRFYGECFNKKYDGMSVIKMQQIPKIFDSLIDNEQEKYFFFEPLDIDTIKSIKKENLKEKLNELE